MQMRCRGILPIPLQSLLLVIIPIRVLRAAKLREFDRPRRDLLDLTMYKPAGKLDEEGDSAGPPLLFS
jgi:hypothetical protein